jgi:hypothetical protein
MWMHIRMHAHVCGRTYLKSDVLMALKIYLWLFWLYHVVWEVLIDISDKHEASILQSKVERLHVPLKHW